MGLQMLNTAHVDWTEEIAMKLMSKSWEILNHICLEPRFAKVVKSITVIAFADGQCIFERCKSSYTALHIAFNVGLTVL